MKHYLNIKQSSAAAIAEFEHRIRGYQRIAYSPIDRARIANNIGVVDYAMASMPERVRKRSADIVELMRKDTGTSGIIANFIGSTPRVDRMKDSIAQTGWKLDAYRKNPVVLFAHDSGSLPVGRAVSVGLSPDGKALMFGVKFAQTGLGKAVASMVAGGFLNACSVGFAPGEFKFSSDPTRKNGIDFLSGHELLELSIVPVPANPEALLQSITGTDGKSHSPAKVKAKREREVELAKLKFAPLSDKERRRQEVARLRRRG